MIAFVLVVFEAVILFNIISLSTCKLSCDRNRIENINNQKERVDLQIEKEIGLDSEESFVYLGLGLSFIHDMLLK